MSINLCNDSCSSSGRSRPPVCSEGHFGMAGFLGLRSPGGGTIYPSVFRLVVLVFFTESRSWARQYLGHRLPSGLSWKETLIRSSPIITAHERRIGRVAERSGSVFGHFY